MEESILKATHTGILTIGDIGLSCYVLEDGRRIFKSGDLLSIFGLTEESKDQPRILSSFLDKIRVNSILNKGISNPILEPVKFSIPGKGGRPIKGYMARVG